MIAWPTTFYCRIVVSCRVFVCSYMLSAVLVASRTTMKESYLASSGSFTGECMAGSPSWSHIKSSFSARDY